MIDKCPLVIARCVDAADEIMALNFGRDKQSPDSGARRWPQQGRAAPACRCIIAVGG